MTTPLPAAIRASIHEDAINRVSRFFNASFDDIIKELFQNARRANATYVDVTLKDNVVTVSDDGDGIADPRALLAFGHSHWNQRIADSEDPAGMGVYALAYTGAEIRSQARGADSAWRVNLETRHFTGEAEAPITSAPSDANQHGVSITFEHQGATTFKVASAAAHFPLPVWLNGEMLPNEDFLAQAIYVEQWRGTRIGVFRTHNSFSRHDQKINFHGAVVRQAGLPVVEGIENHWHASVDVVNCPELQFVLPARREVVQNEFMERLKQACKAAIYQAMSRQPVSDAYYRDFTEAASMGIKLPTPPARLKPWQPKLSNSAMIDEENERQAIDPTAALLLDRDALTTADSHALNCAVQDGKCPKTLWQDENNLAGYDWYDRIPKAETVEIMVSFSEEIHDLETLRKQPLVERRPDQITFVITTNAGETIEVDAPLAFRKPEPGNYDDPEPLVCVNASITPDDLADFMVEAFFEANVDDYEYDSPETQQEDCELNYRQVALRTMQSDTIAAITTIRYQVARYVSGLVPPGQYAVITASYGKPVDVALHPEAQE